MVLGWTSIYSEINIAPFIFYIGAIFWTLGYDTIYGFQDIKDDEIIGLKSTSIKFKNNPKIFLFLSYTIFFISLLFIGIGMDLNNIYFLFLLFIFFHLYILQIYQLKIKDTVNCLKIFKSNNTLGFLVFLSLIIGKLNL